VLAMAVGYFYIDHLRNFVDNRSFEPLRISTYVLIASILLVLILRTLKHSGKLDESDRS